MRDVACIDAVSTDDTERARHGVLDFLLIEGLDNTSPDTVGMVGGLQKAMIMGRQLVEL